MINQDEFEVWLEDHREEVLDRIEVERMSLTDWVKQYCRGLKIELSETKSDFDPDDDINDDLPQELK